MPSEFAFDVFLSHNARDKDRVRGIAERLREAGLKVWFDEWSIAPGEDIYLALERGLESSRTLVLFLSSAALGSNWVDLERSAALFRDPTNAQRRFLPVLLEDCKLPDALRRYRYVDLREENDAAMAQLVAACRGEALPPASPLPDRSKPKRRQPAKPRKPPAQKILPFALLSLGSFLAGALLLWILVAQADKLVGLGLEGKLYYLVLLPLGLSVAAFLFGALHSYALYRGKLLGGVLELGGPVVVFCLVVLGGFLLVPETKPFDVTVFVHGEGGVHDIPLRGEGSVVLDLGQDRRQKPIDAQGQADFKGISPSLRGQKVPIFVEAKGFETMSGSAPRRLEEGSLYLPVRRLPVPLRGQVQDDEGQPIAGAKLQLNGLITNSGENGSFFFEVPVRLLDEKLFLDVSASGYKPWHDAAYLHSNAIVVKLTRE